MTRRVHPARNAWREHGTKSRDASARERSPSRSASSYVSTTMMSRSGRSPTSYVALLRGVNVGGHAKVPMAALRELFASLGFGAVRTYIQSGNVVFESSEQPNPADIEDAILQSFALSPRVVVLSAESLARVVEAVPFDATEASHVHVGFATQAIAAAIGEEPDLARFSPERCVIAGSAIYLCLPSGVGQAKLPSYLERRIGYPVTYRNWATVNKLIEMASTLSEPRELR